MLIARLGRALALALLFISAPAAAESRHAAYVEVLGKGGLWGLGYDYQLTRRLAVGSVGSYYVLGGDHFATLSPYVAAYPLRGARHGWFVHAGPQLVHRATPSPVPEWSGASATTLDLELSTGYEYRGRVILHVYGMTAIGDRVVPWIGAGIGWSP